MQMQVLAALGDAPTAVIAVVAIVLGVLLAARGPREKRASAGTADAPESTPAPTLLEVPVTAARANVEPGFVGPEGTVVGHGRIRLGGAGPPSAAPPGAVDPPPAPPAPDPVAAPQAPPIAAEPAMFEPQPIGADPAISEPQPTVSQPPAADPAVPAEPAGPEEPAWRVAARTANDAVHFRQGTIKLGGRAAGKKEDR